MGFSSLRIPYRSENAADVETAQHAPQHSWLNTGLILKFFNTTFLCRLGSSNVFFPVEAQFRNGRVEIFSCGSARNNLKLLEPETAGLPKAVLIIAFSGGIVKTWLLEVFELYVEPSMLDDLNPVGFGIFNLMGLFSLACSI
jgi:hypothetical protein